MRTIRIFVSGTVQGVFFRAFVEEEADKLDLKGFVRNLDDDRVEVVIEGREKDVEKMIEKCRKGCPYSQVKDVEIEKMRHQGFKEFKILKF